MSEDFKVFFIEEAAELFESIHKVLLNAEEKGAIDENDIDGLFRDVHTLKGGSGSVGLTLFSGYVHYLENFMSSIRDNKVDVTEDVISFLMEQVDFLEDLLHEDFSDKVEEERYEKDISELKKQIDIFSGVGGGSKTTDKSNNNDSASELIDIYDNLSAELEIADLTNEFSKDRLAVIFRYVHTLKGSSAFLGLTKYPNYIHFLEDMLDRVRNEEIPYTKEINSLVDDKIKIAQSILDDEFAKTIDDYDYDNLCDELKESITELVDPPSEPVAFELFGFDDDSVNTATTPKKETPDDEDSYELFLGDDNKQNQEKVKEPVDKSTEKEVVTPAIEKEKPKEKVAKSEKKPTKKGDSKSVKNIVASSSIRVGLDKIDNLMNRVGDLVITKSMLYEYGESITGIVGDVIMEKLGYLDREMRELQEAVMSVRMVPMESVYSKLPKIVRDLAKKLGKKVKFEHIGDSVEIDKLMVEGLMDPLTHIIRNSLDHGVEMPDDRTAKRKRAVGLLKIEAAQESGNIIITISDDGAGINTEKVGAKAVENGIISEEELGRMEESEKAMLIFNAGLSTAEKVTDVSGRGVGMDVVMNNITSLGGVIKIETRKDVGSKFIIILPLTLAIMDGLNVLIGNNRLILPLNLIVESLQPHADMIKRVGEQEEEILMLRNEFIPIVRLHKFFGLRQNAEELEEGMLIITRVSEQKIALFVDDFLNQEQIVVKSLDKNYKQIKGVSAATIRGDGSIGYILDIASIVEEIKLPPPELKIA